MVNVSLFSVKNISDEDIYTRSNLSIKKDEEKVIFLNPYLHNEHGSILIELLLEGKISAYDVWGDVMMLENAINAINFIITKCVEIGVYGTNILDRNAYMKQVLWNVSMKDYIISIVRSDMLYVGLNKFNLNGLIVAKKLESVIPLLFVGQFKEASIVLDTIEVDGYLTNELLNKYKIMLNSADAIQY